MDGQEMLCEFQVPLRYGNRKPDKKGEPIEPEIVLRVHEVLNRQFHGYTPLGKIEGGSWLDEKTGLFEVEDSLQFRVWVTEERIAILKQVVAAIGRELGQIEMGIIVFNSNVLRIKIESTGTEGLAPNK